jgi:hypothetical protein
MTLVRTDLCVGIRMIAKELKMDIETVTNLNNKFEHEKSVCQNGPTKNPRVFSRKTYTNARTRSVLIKSYPCDLYLFPRLNSSSKEPTFIQLKICIRKAQSYLKQFHRMTSGDTSRTARLVWGSV